MDLQLENHLKEMTKEDFREMLRKLEIAINDNEDTDSITEVQRYELYKLDLENKFSETDIAITTVDELMLLEQAASIEDFKEDLQTYRASLDANLNATPQNVDNYADFESINVKITEMKAMVAELQSFINEYKKNKSNLSETERTAKEKEIDEKQAAIEAKRKEIQAIIDKIKKVWTDINFVDITDPTIKTTLQKQKEKEEKWIKNYQKNLDNVITPASTFREKLNNTGKKTWGWIKENPVATGGIVLGAGLLVAWIAGAFKKKNKKTEEGGEDEGGKKKGFRRTGFGKFVKWTAIGVGGFLGLRWLFKELTNKTPDDPKNEVDDYNDLPPEQKETYESLGDEINQYYENIYAKELNSGWSYKERLGIIAENVQIAEGYTKEELSGVVPFVMNKNFSSVDKVLSEEGYKLQIISDDLLYYKTQVLAWGESVLEDFLFPYVSKLASFATLGLSSSESIKSRMDKRFDAGDPNERLTEIQLFFRQYMKVLTYFQDKKEQLILQIIGDKEYDGKKISEYPEEERYELINDLLNDEERAEENIVNDARYISFMGGSLYNGIAVLKSNNLFDANASAQIQNGVDALDEERDEILEYDENTSKDALQRGEEDIADGSIETTTQNELLGVCNRFSTHIEDHFEETLCGFLGIFNPMYEEVFDKREKLKQDFLEHIGAAQMKYQFKKDIADYKQKIVDGTMTKEDYKIFSDKINGFLVFKKELFLATETMYSITMQNGSLFFQITDLFKAVRSTFKNRCGKGWDNLLNGKNRGENILGFWMLSGPVALGSYLLSSNKYVGKIMKPINRVAGGTFFAPYSISRYAQARGGRMVAGKYRGGPRVLFKRVFIGQNGYNNFQEAMKNGRLSGGQVRGMVNNTEVRAAWNITDGPDKVVADAFGLSNASNMRSAADRADDLLRAMDNQSMRKLLRKGGINGNNLADVFKSYTEKMDLGGLSTNQRGLMDGLLKHGEFENVADLQKIIDNIDGIDVDNLSPKQVRKLAKKLGKDISIFDDPAQVNARIDEINPPNAMPNGPRINSVLDVADPTIVKEKVAYDVYETRKNNALFDDEFKTGGKYQDYADIETDLDNGSGGKKTVREAYASITNDTELAKLDKIVSDEMIARNDRLVSEILEANKTAQFTEFGRLIDAEMNQIENLKSLGVNSNPGVQKSLQKQRENLDAIKKMTSTMNVQELNALQALYKSLNARPGVMFNITEAWEKARTNDDIMKALSDGDGRALRKLKLDGVIDITDEAIEVFEEIQLKKIAKVLGAGNAPTLLEAILKGVARMT